MEEMQQAIDGGSFAEVRNSLLYHAINECGISVCMLDIRALQAWHHIERERGGPESTTSWKNRKEERNKN